MNIKYTIDSLCPNILTFGQGSDMQLIGFARVSTNSQDLANQLKMLEDFGCSKVFNGKQSGTSKENEIKLKELVDYVREGDTVVVTKLDRLGRSLKSILETIQQITDKRATLKTLDGAIDTTNSSPFAQAQLNLIGTFAQLERDLIVQRTTEGRDAAKNKGVKFGRKSVLTEEQRQSIKKKLSKGATVYALAKEYEVSRQTIMRVRDQN